MFVSSGQLYVFVCCVAFGFCSGVLFNLFKPLKDLFVNKIINYFIDFFVFSLLGIIYCRFTILANFPSLRAYMLFGVFAGLFIYFKSFYITIAKNTKKLYNIISKFLGLLFFWLRKISTRNIRKGLFNK